VQDGDHLLPALFAVILALIGASFAISLGGHLDSVVRTVSIFTIMGTMVAYRARRRGSRLEPFTLIARYQGLGLGLGMLFEAVKAVV
jgi:hypothetical protein